MGIDDTGTTEGFALAQADGPPVKFFLCKIESLSSSQAL